jgi:hypothetical protein
MREASSIFVFILLLEKKNYVLNLISISKKSNWENKAKIKASKGKKNREEVLLPFKSSIRALLHCVERIIFSFLILTNHDF